MRRRKWLEVLILLVVGVYAGLIWFSWATVRMQPDVKVTQSLLTCKDLAVAAVKYMEHPANTNQQLPNSVGDLIRPPWGGPSLFRDETEEPLDPWVNPFRIEHR